MEEIDLRTCKRGDILISSRGEDLKYVKPCPPGDFYDLIVEYANGQLGTRTHEGYVFRNVRIPEEDSDIIKIIKK